jgi:hypothetical protein
MIRLLVMALCVAVPGVAQAPNTAAIVVVVTDQSGAVVRDAAVTVVDSRTGAMRDVTSGADGTGTISGLPVGGPFAITVTKNGFAPESSTNVTLRAGETATVKVKLLVGGEKAQITVYGTTEGVRTNPQMGERLDSKRIDETPILGRKITSLALLNSTFRPAKGTGDLFVNATYFVTAAGGRRETTVTVDGASDD